MTPPAPLKPGQKRRYIARVRDVEGDHPKHGDDWFRVITRSNMEGEFGTRAWAQEALESAQRNYRHGKLVGHTDDVVIVDEPTLETIKVDKYLFGNVVPIADVPKQFRPQYRDTLARIALAAHRAGTTLYVSSSFRTRDEQVELYAKFLAGGPLAAKPGTSPHERGISIDVPNVRLMKAVIKELEKLDVHDDVPSEIWHLTNHHRV